MAVFSQNNSSSPDIAEEIIKAKDNPLVIARQYSHFIEHTLGVQMADPEWSTKPLDPILAEMAIRSDFGKDYDYTPDKMSFELYGTHELWPLLLRLNNVSHRGEFLGPNLSFISPIYTGQLLKLAKFGIKRAERADARGIPNFGDLTVRRVYA